MEKGGGDATNMYMSLFSAFCMEWLYVYKITSTFQVMPSFLLVARIDDEGKCEQP